MRMLPPFVLVVGLFCFCLPGVRAATINAGSCSQTAVQLAINSASAGDTVTVPACSETTWSTLHQVGSTENYAAIVVYKPITLQGAGSTSTLIKGGLVIDPSYHQHLIQYSPDANYGTQYFRWTGFGVNCDYNTRPFQATDGWIRLDHNRFTKTVTWSNFETLWGDVKGVIDHNYCEGGCSPEFAGAEMATWNTRTYTPGTTDSLVLEDNTFDLNENSLGVLGFLGSGNGKWGWTARYNTFNLSGSAWPLFDQHGNQPGNVMGVLGIEIYGNRIYCTGAPNTYGLFAMAQRGGQNLYYYNYFDTNCGTPDLQMWEEFPDNIETTNTWESGLFGGTSDGQPFHVSRTYYWNNRYGTSLLNAHVRPQLDCCNDPGPSAPQSNDCCYHGVGNPALVEGLDYWNTDSIGCGPSTPTGSCTSGNAYWKTSQSCSSVPAANTGANPASGPLVGTLYKCVSGSWQAYYTPYAYPHPLTFSGQQTCSQLGGTPCQSGQACSGGSFQYSSDYGSLCCVGGTCQTPSQTCSDGTAYNSCSSTKPLYCSSGTLTNNCQSCGCPTGQTCQSGGTCLSTQTCSELGGVDCCTSGETCGGTTYSGSSDCSGTCCSQTCTIQPITGNLLINGDFESGFTNGIGNNWLFDNDGSVQYTASQDAGYQGSSQKIAVTVPGSWGLYLYQTPAFQANQWYNWSFWYKAETGNITAQITNSDNSQLVFLKRLTPTSGAWQYVSLQFLYSNTQADQLRFATNRQGSYWLDDVQLIPIAQPSCHKSDSDCSGCVDSQELTAFIGRWYLSNADVTLKELMEAIGFWKRGC